MPETASPTLTETQSPTRLFRTGRQPGTRNVVSGKIKENIVKVFEGLGSWENMLRWARENETIFYTQLYGKLLPTENYQKGSGSIRVLVYAPNSGEQAPQPVVLAAMSDESVSANSEDNQQVAG